MTVPTLVDSADVLLELGISSPTAAQQNTINAEMVKAVGAIKRYLRYDPCQRERTEYYPQKRMQSPIGESVWEVNDTSAYIREATSYSTDELQLLHIPVRSVASVYVDSEGRSGAKTGGFDSSTLKVQGEDYWPNYDAVDSLGVKICKDGILRAIGLWPISPGSVKVTYTAGYTQSELRGTDSIIDASPIWETAIKETARRVRRVLALSSGTLGVPVGMITSENLGDYSYSIDTASATAQLFGGDLLQDSIQRLADFVNWGWEV